MSSFEHPSQYSADIAGTSVTTDASEQLADTHVPLDTLTAAQNTLRHALEIGNKALAAEMHGVIASEQ